ncbi:uncharacterized protein LOC108866641 [Pyrus x bretschneideri]|uniref:uncharacterized protein LOC108866641 n=1 Tax=Pyrus x bretschneideri TaxID=225117 RepID=UPI002030088B|nr:uncharacterized protein LOC108866641 [Pyrus x bretschneideri]
MASRKDQVVPATNAKNNILAVSGGTLGVTTQSKARVISVIPSILPNEQEHPSHEPVITLTSLRAPKEESPKRYFESLTFDADSSNILCLVTMQVMTTGVTLIKEQLAQMSEVIARLTRTVEEKDLQIATLVNRLKAHHDEKANPKVDPPKKEIDEENEPLVEKVKKKLKKIEKAKVGGLDDQALTHSKRKGKPQKSQGNPAGTANQQNEDNGRQVETGVTCNPAGTPNQQNEVNGRQVETVVTGEVDAEQNNMRQAETVDSPVDCSTRELKVAAFPLTLVILIYVKLVVGNPAETANPQNEVTGTQVEIGVTVNIEQQDNPDLPFVKSYPEIWEKVESMDAFKRYPQKPHFYPLVKCGELSRESLAVAKMLTFASLVEKTSKLNIEDPGDFFDSIFEELGDLETFGFDVKAVRDRLNSLLDIKVQLAHVQDKSKEVQIKIAEQTQDRKKHNEIICGVAKQIKDLQDQLVVLMSEDAAKGSEISRLQSEADAITESIQSIRRMTHWLKHGDPCESILLITALSTETELKVIPS